MWLPVDRDDPDVVNHLFQDREVIGLAVDGARPLSRNRYKVPLVENLENLVRRTLLSLAGSA